VRHSRRAFLRAAVVSSAVVALPATLSSCVSTSPVSKKLPRIGYLAGSHDPATDPLIDAFHAGLVDLGYIDGKTMQYELRWGEGSLQRFEEYAAEFVRMPVDVMASSHFDAQSAMRRATSTIPIVLIQFPDPVGTGWVQSLSRPGGNITGSGVQPAATTTKRLEMLKETVPPVSRVAVLWDGTAARQPTLRALDEAGRSLGLELVTLEVGAAGAAAALTRAFDTATARGTDALLLLPSQIHIVQLRKEIVDYVTARRIPSSFPSFGGYVEAGGLMAYGENAIDVFRRTASFVDRILKGANPAELPIEQPTKFDLVINLKTARELGLVIPQAILSRATQVIQ
jgi:putative ABC transport system substrate-binding protein